MSIRSQFYKECSEVFKKEGFFALNRNRFIRYINGMIHVAEFQVSTSSQMCEVNWGAFPTTTKLASDDIFMCNHCLGEFDIGYGWFEFNSKNEVSIRRCVANIKLRIVNNLIPFFEKCISFSGSYQQLCLFEKAVYGETQFADYSKGILAVCFGDYELSLHHFTALYQQHKSALERNIESGLSDFDYIAQANEDIIEIQCLMKYAQHCDQNAFLKVMRSNELRIMQALPPQVLRAIHDE